MPTASIKPVYYQVVWNGTSPTNYNALSGTQAGGIDNTNAESYNRIRQITGTNASPTVTAGQTIAINNVIITFSSTTLSSVISDINARMMDTGVFAVNLGSDYLTLMNAPTFENLPIWLAAGATGTGLSDLGLTAGVYNNWPTAVGGSTSLGSISTGNNIIINGITITFTFSGSLSIAAAVATINNYTSSTNVVAFPSGAGIQLCGVSGQPFNVNDGTTTVSNLGFTAGDLGGTPTTLAQSLDKELANMRWGQVVIGLGSLISPIYLGNITKTGNYDGTDVVDSLTFTVGYDRESYLYIEDVTNPGTYLTGTAAVKRMIATALMGEVDSNQEIFDPTITNFGAHCERVNPSQIVELIASALDTSITTLEGNFTVTQISNVG